MNGIPFSKKIVDRSYFNDPLSQINPSFRCLSLLLIHIGAAHFNKATQGRAINEFSINRPNPGLPGFTQPHEVFSAGIRDTFDLTDRVTPTTEAAVNGK